MGVAGEAFAVFRDLHAVFGLNPAVIHLAAWLCSWVKFICRDRGGLPDGLLLVLADCRPVRGEAVRGGAGKGCYGKCGIFYYMECIFMRIKKPHLRPIVITLSVGGILLTSIFLIAVIMVFQL